jgi:hypothetical protein
MIPYNNVASDYLQSTRYFRGNVVDANMAMSIPDTLAMFLVPTLGIWLDRRGKKVSLMVAGAATFLVGHTILALGRGRFVAVSALLTLGFAYGTLLSFWACVPALVHGSRHSTAYGILTSACNLAVTLISPLAVAPIIAADSSYRLCGLFFAGLGGIAVALSLLIAGINKKRRLGLNVPVRHVHSLSFSAMGEVLVVEGEGSEDSGRTTPSQDDALFVSIVNDGSGEGTKLFLFVT